MAEKAKAAFVTTQWSRVINAGRQTSPEAADDLASLCRDYWYPLFAHVRRHGHGPEDAQDLTQAFFEQLLQKSWLRDVDPLRGRFRTFLLTALNHFLANAWDKAQAQKRGGRYEHLPFDTQSAETQFQQEPQSQVTPETDFNRRWAIALLDRVLRCLREDYTAEGKGRLFELLKDTLEGGRSETPQAQLAAQVGLSEGATRVAIHRLRQRYREILQVEISRTVNSADDVETELRDLFAALGS